MKQVASSPFWGVGGASDTSMEARIVRAVAEAGLTYAENPRKSARFNEQRKASLKGRVLRNIQTLLHARLKSYLRAIAGRLLDREHILDNNCQRFCNAIIDRRVFSNFMLHKRNESCVTRWGVPPLYLLSFVSRIGCHDGFPKRVVPASKDVTANGHTEKFLLRHQRFGHHNDTNIAFPFNAWSVAQLHLCRERRFYAPAFFGNAAAAAAQLSLDGWRRNRLDVLEAVRTLGVVAVAMRASPVFRHACRWSFAPRGLVFPDDRGGRRAQPASHLYEHSMLHDCTVAGWADLAPREQVAAYVALRDARAVDVDGEAYEAGDVVLEGHDGSGAQVYYDGQGTCDCVCDAAGHCDVNAGVDYTNGGEAFTADGFVPFEIGDGDGNVGR
ncbi:hypothetical protein RB596_009189 [Gaeumannomyces avenae]